MLGSPVRRSAAPVGVAEYRLAQLTAAPTSFRGGQLAAQLNDDSQPKFGAVARTSSAPRPETAGQVAGRPGPPLADPLAYQARPITMGPLGQWHH